MFKSYLTYSFALSFHELCFCLDIPPITKARLQRSADQLLLHLNRGMRAEKTDQAGVEYFTAAINLKDCKQILDETESFKDELAYKCLILEQRFEEICEHFADAQDGQMKMFG